jgi:hypothetical protein
MRRSQFFNGRLVGAEDASCVFGELSLRGHVYSPV